MVCFIILFQYCSGEMHQAKVIDKFLFYYLLEFFPPGKLLVFFAIKLWFLKKKKKLPLIVKSLPTDLSWTLRDNYTKSKV